APALAVADLRDGRVGQREPRVAEDLRPVRERLADQPRTGFGYPRERLQALERPARVDQRSGVVWCRRVYHEWIDAAAPRLTHDVDVLGRIAARAHGPHDFVKVHGIDVVVDHDHESIHVRGGVALGGDVAGLARM